MISTYKKTKEDVLKIYHDFLPLITCVKGGRETSYDNSLVSLAKQAENIEQDKFLLMVVGEAKSGKSTFINAYLGEKILPMDVKQCTSAIVEISYGQKFVLKATYADERTNIIEDKEEIKKFLISNAAMDDNYRDIPVSAINIKLLMPKKGKRILDSEIRDLVKNMKEDNLYHLPESEYEAKIYKYIKERQPVWRDIVKKIEIKYPFKDDDLKNIEIVDTPGVNADGRVGEITNKYIEDANAVMFLKPIVGAALESISFRRFLKTKSANRNSNAIFLLLTRSANETPDNVSRLYDEALRQYPEINCRQIIPVDSKAELFYNSVKELTAEDLTAELMDLVKEYKVDAFIIAEWFTAGGNREKFLQNLKKLSNFKTVDDALNLFAHKAQYLALSEFLGRMIQVVEIASDKLEETIDLYKEKAEDPIELGHKMNVIKRELEELTRRIHEDVDKVADKYARTDGVIDQKAKDVIEQYKVEIEKIDGTQNASLDELEKISFQKIDTFTRFETELQKNIVAECDAALVALSNKSDIKYSTLKPNLTKESFEKIKEDLKDSDEAKETYTYTTGITFEQTHRGSRFSQSKYYGLVKDSIQSRIDGIKNQAITDLKRFVRSTTTTYSEELAKNAKIKRDEYNDIAQKKQTADEIQEEIKKLESWLIQLQPMSEQMTSLKGGIDKCL